MPCSVKLEKRWHVSSEHAYYKIDKQYLELDTAYAFLHTDLLNSPWLCDLLVEAGCEQLCDLVSDGTEENRKTGYALDAVRYLGLPETVYSEFS